MLWQSELKRIRFVTSNGLGHLEKEMGEGTILLIEGEQAGEHSLQNDLRRTGHAVQVAHTLADALQVTASSPPGLVVFDDRTLPDAVQKERAALAPSLANVPFIQIVPEGGEKPQTEGAHIVLRQPFTPRMLITRVQRYLPPKGRHDRILVAGDIALNLDRRTVAIEGLAKQCLTPKLTRLLEVCMRRRDSLVSRRELMLLVWDTDYMVDTRTLDVHIHWLRQAIEEDPSNPTRLTTVRGKGYIFNTMPRS